MQGRRLGIGLLLLMSASTAIAHHSFGMFDMKKELTIKGVVKNFEWTNPHIWIDVGTKDASNKEVVYSVECDSVDYAVGKGWTRHSFKAGDAVTLVVHPVRASSTVTLATARGRRFSSSALQRVVVSNGAFTPASSTTIRILPCPITCSSERRT
jgi:hypothetical protein